MMQYHSFTFNFASEQTYLVWDETTEACVIDPGCFTPEEEATLVGFIEKNKLNLTRAICTHLHFDHCIGGPFVKDKWGLDLEAPALEIELLPSLKDQLRLFGLGHIAVKEMSPVPLDEKDSIKFGNTELRVLSVPGHSPAHVVFYEKVSGVIFAGDTLFNMGIGRTDLWGGDYDTLISSIRGQLFSLPDDTVVLPGHGPATSVGYEKRNNPYFSRS